jgi:hypothetical protein
MSCRYYTLQAAPPGSGCATTQEQVETYTQDFQRRLQHLENNRWWFEMSHFNTQLNTSVGHLWMLFSAVWPCARLERIGAVMDGGAELMASKHMTADATCNCWRPNSVPAQWQFRARREVDMQPRLHCRRRVHRFQLGFEWRRHI